VARGRSSTCSLGAALGDRITAPLGGAKPSRPRAKTETSSARSSACAPRLEQRLLAHMGKPVGILVRTADESRRRARRQFVSGRRD